MNRKALSDIQASIPFAVNGSPVPLQLPSGSAIYAYRGEVWITQEGMFDDVILGPGQRFDVRGRGMILASAIRGNAFIFVAAPVHAADRDDGGLLAFLRRCARRLHDEQVPRVARAARALLWGAAGAASAPVRR